MVVILVKGTILENVGSKLKEWSATFLGSVDSESDVLMHEMWFRV